MIVWSNASVDCIFGIEAGFVYLEWMDGWYIGSFMDRTNTCLFHTIVFEGRTCQKLVLSLVAHTKWVFRRIDCTNGFTNDESCIIRYSGRQGRVLQSLMVPSQGSVRLVPKVL